MALLNLFLFSFFSLIAQTESSPHHKGLLSSINLGIRYSSLLENRGVIFYRDFQMDPVVGLFFFDDRLEYLGDSIGFRDFVAGRWLRLRTRLVSISDNPLFPAIQSIKSGAPDREDTFEWSNRAEFFFPGYDADYLAEIDLGHAKDLSVHKGQYIDLQAKIKLFSTAVPIVGTRVEPNLYLSAGWGDLRHNRYFYGPEQNSTGLTNSSYGIWFAFPQEADRFYPIVLIKKFQTLGEFRNGSLVKNRSDDWLFSFIATATVW